MVDEAKLKKFGGFDEAFGESAVGVARARVTGWVIMNQHETVGIAKHDGAQDFARVGAGFVECAGADFDRSGVAQAAIDGGDE